jgi:hypothetical protein
MTHLKAERETVERLRRQLIERRGYRDLLLDLNEEPMVNAAEIDDGDLSSLPGDSISIDWTSEGQHDWTG